MLTSIGSCIEPKTIRLWVIRLHHYAIEATLCYRAVGIWRLLGFGMVRERPQNLNFLDDARLWRQLSCTHSEIKCLPLSAINCRIFIFFNSAETVHCGSYQSGQQFWLQHCSKFTSQFHNSSNKQCIWLIWLIDWFHIFKEGCPSALLIYKGPSA